MRSSSTERSRATLSTSDRTDAALPANGNAGIGVTESPRPAKSAATSTLKPSKRRSEGSTSDGCSGVLSKFARAIPATCSASSTHLTSSAREHAPRSNTKTTRRIATLISSTLNATVAGCVAERAFEAIELVVTDTAEFDVRAHLRQERTARTLTKQPDDRLEGTF